MLKKLLKYDLQWVYKVVVVFYILSFFFSAIGRGFSIIENSLLFSIISKILFGIAISMVVSSLINCIMRLWARFVKNVYKDESYLTHTIPMPKKTIFLSKVLAAIISILITTIIGVLCICICYYSKENMEVLKSLLELAATTYNTTVMKLLALVSVVFFLEVVYIVLIGYVGIILGHKSNKNKMVKSIVIGFALYMIMQMVTFLVILGYGIFNSDIMNLIKTTTMLEIEAIKSLMYIAIGIYSVYSIALYVFGKKELEKGVNVD